MPEDKSNKTEPASARRRQEEREKGNVARSQDLNTAAILFAAIMLLYFFGNGLLESLLWVHDALFRSLDVTSLTTGDLQGAVAVGLTKIGTGMAPLLIGLLLAGLLVSISQVGFHISAKPMEPKPEKLNPVTGLGRMVSKRSMVKLVASVLKLAVISIVLYLTAREMAVEVMPLMQQEAGDIFAFVMSAAFTLALRMALLLLILAFVDYAFQKWQHEQDIKMSKQEVKDEMKLQEGDPRTRERRMRAQREIAKQRMMHKVPEADVVITNPTHLACAIRYDEETMVAPTLLAKGAGAIAQQIRYIAAEHGIPVIEKPPLAQAIYKTVEIGQEVPPDLYQAVAEILAYVYRLDGTAA